MFYHKFKKLCDERGVSCNKAALEMGLSSAAVPKWKKTGYTPRGDTLSKIAKYFGISISELLGEENKETPLVNGDQELTDYLEMLKNRPECRMLFQLTKNATKEDVEAAVRIIEALRNK